MKTRVLALILAAALATVFAGGAFAQDKSPRLYKWVDKNGIVHYGSSVPPEYANQTLEVLNSEGLTVKTIQAHKPAEAPQDKAAAAAKAQQEQAQQATDQMLLDTYTSVADIEQDRDTHLKALNAQIDITNAAISGLQDNLASYQRHEQQLEREHRPIPTELKNNLLNIQQQLEADQKLLVQQQQQKPALQAQYDAYIKRFQQLTANPNNGGR